MTHSRGSGESGLWTRAVRRFGGAAVAGGLLAVVLLVPRGEGPAPVVPPDAAVTLPSPVVVAVAPAVFCSAFRELADAHNQYVASSTEASATRVLDQAAAVVDLGVPRGFSDAGYAAFAELVVGILSPIEDSGELRARVLSVARTESPDPGELDRYLGEVCPA